MKDLPAWPIRTSRLLLRPFAETDIAAAWTYRGLPTVTTWTGAYLTSYPQWVDLASRTLPNRVAITLPSGALVGDLTLQVTDAWHQFGADPRAARGSSAELGWAIDPAYAGRGYATEASTEAVRLAFDHIGVRRVTASAFADNAASIRVMEKIGMRHEATTRADSFHATRGWTDGAWYALLVDEWRARHG